MPSGGPRGAGPGQVYSNRSDMTGDATYGDGVNKKAVKAATPNTRPTTPSAPAGIPPEALTELGATTERPDEPLTAGLASGPGGGPESVAGYQNPDPALWELRALAARFPEYRDLRRIIAQAEANL